MVLPLSSLTHCYPGACSHCTEAAVSQASPSMTYCCWCHPTASRESGERGVPGSSSDTVQRQNKHRKCFSFRIASSSVTFFFLRKEKLLLHKWHNLPIPDFCLKKQKREFYVDAQWYQSSHHETAYALRHNLSRPLARNYDCLHDGRMRFSH